MRVLLAVTPDGGAAVWGSPSAAEWTESVYDLEVVNGVGNTHPMAVPARPTAAAVTACYEYVALAIRDRVLVYAPREQLQPLFVLQLPEPAVDVAWMGTRDDAQRYTLAVRSDEHDYRYNLTALLRRKRGGA